MFESTLTKINKYISSGHYRSVKAKKNILGSFLIKGASILINLLLIPLTINYLNPTKYGIWITLSSIIGWFSFFDIGLGNGLRNKFAEALANGEKILARVYVSTTYAVLSIIIALVLIVFYFINPFLNWTTILNAGGDAVFKNELSVLALVVFSFFCLRFVFQLIAIIIIADQQPAKAALFNLYSNALALIFIIILTKTTNGSLVLLGIIFSSLPVFVFLISSIWFFNKNYKYYRPSIKYVDFSKVKELFSLGTKFFFIQIAAVLLYETNNIIISQLFGPAEVTPYNVAFRYFNVLMMVFTIIITPFWSAFTEAWVKEDFKWIKSIMKKLFKGFLTMLIIGLFMLLVSPLIYKIWIGNSVGIPFVLSALVGFWVILNIWNSIFSQFLNGIGKVKLQLYMGMGGALLNLPLAIYLGSKLGITGVLVSNIIVGITGLVIYPVQYHKIMNNTANGIWGK